MPNQLLRKYVAYARKYVKPSLSPEAAEVIQVCVCVYVCVLLCGDVMYVYTHVHGCSLHTFILKYVFRNFT